MVAGGYAVSSGGKDPVCRIWCDSVRIGRILSVDYNSVNVFQALETGKMAVTLFENLLYFANTPEYLSDAANYAARLLLVELYVRNSVSESGSPALVSDICSYVKAHAGENIMVRDVAAEFSISEGHITRLFNKYYSMGLKNYIDLIRMEHIKKLLASEDIPLKDIAVRSGFDDYDAFLKFFKYRENISPSRFRELV